MKLLIMAAMLLAAAPTWIVMGCAMLDNPWPDGPGEAGMERIVERQWLEARTQKIRAEALWKLCRDGFDTACAQVQDESISAYLAQ